MNNIYKTKWSVSRGQYVVTDEKRTTKGKSTKSALTVAVASVLALGTMAVNAAYTPLALDGSVSEASGATYVENGKITEVGGADQSSTWESEEYNKNWGLHALKASKAYALGFHGQGVKLGVMDSGADLQHNPDLAGDRFHSTHASGTYGQSGTRYPQHAYGKDGPVEGADLGEYHEGDSFDVSGNFTLGVNDSHGTGVTGSMGANRDGHGMHGVSWGSDIYVANTGGTDDTNYGPFLDYNFFKAGYDSLVNSGVKIINNSFGTNLKQIHDDGTPEGYYTSGVELEDVNDVEYEYFLFKQMYGGKKSFVDAAWDAIKGKDVVQVFTAGNNQRSNPYHRALYPYFNPEAESQWISVSGLRELNQDSNNGKYQIETNFNEAGFAKWWTLTGPGQNGYTTAVDKDTGDLKPGSGKFEDGYGSFSGTSMAAPYVTGAFGVLASRYTEMTASQVREVLMTTASHKNKDGTNIEGWNNVNGSTPKEGEVSDRMGWGVPDLDKGMYGPGQFFGKFDYKLNGLDVWSNDISQVAIDQRESEDLQWLKSVTDNHELDGKVLASNGGEYKLDNDMNIAGIADKSIEQADAEKWRQEYFDKKAADIRYKIANGLYDGSLVKRGQGTLVMIGSNSYEGGTTVEEGTLVGFSDSFGIKQVVVNGGNFGVIATYNDELTKNGKIDDSKAKAPEHAVNATINAGGKYLVAAGEEVNVGTLDFKEGSSVGMWADKDQLASLYRGGNKLTGTVQSTGITGDVVAGKNLAFFSTTIDNVSGNKITASLTKDAGGMASSLAYLGANGASIGAAIESNTDSQIFKDFLGATVEQAANSVKSVGSTLLSDVQTTNVLNSLMISDTVTDIASGHGVANRVELDSGIELWATGIGNWSTVDRVAGDVDGDFYAGMIGAQMQVCSTTKLGVFFGAGTTDIDSTEGKVESDDIHLGIYGDTQVANFGIGYGFMYTWQDRDINRSMSFNGQSGYTATNGDADIMQLFAEVAYNGFSTESFAVSPYVGFSWVQTNTDNITDTVGSYKFTTEFDNSNIEVAKLGLKGAIPFDLGSAKLNINADVNWMHLFGDTDSEFSLRMADSGVAKIAGTEVEDLGSVNLGIEAQFGKATTLGVSYTGVFGDDYSSNGASINLRYAF